MLFSYWGGGYIATEFACIFNGFGCDVTLILRGKTILTAFDQGMVSPTPCMIQTEEEATFIDSQQNTETSWFFPLDVRSKLTDELKKNGIKLQYETEIKSVEKLADDSYRVNFKNQSSSLETNLIMFAIGRKPATDKLGLEQAGVKINDKGIIQVDDYSQTSVSNIYAVWNHSSSDWHDT